MPFEYEEEIAIADVAIHAWDETLEGALQAAAEATSQLMVEDLQSIRPERELAIEIESGALDMLLFDLLQELIFQKDAHRLLLRVGRVGVRRHEARYRLRALASGEPIDPQRHRLGADVKAVTLHGLEVRRSELGWEARVVLDV